MNYDMELYSKQVEKLIVTEPKNRLMENVLGLGEEAGEVQGKIKKLIHATTLYNGRTVSNRKDLHMLLHSLWSSKEQQGIIARIMSECMGGDSHAANKLYSQASKALKELQQANFASNKAPKNQSKQSRLAIGTSIEHTSGVQGWSSADLGVVC